MVNKVLIALGLVCLTGGLVRMTRHDDGADVVVLVDDVVEDPCHSVQLDVGEENPDPVQTIDSRATAWTVRCGGFPPLLCLKDWISGNVRVGVRSR
jgi:hypothetical protein